MSDSSSDSEDDSNRFREVCDPTLSVKFNEVKEETTLGKNNYPLSDDPRESFKLVNQVKKLVATLQFTKG